MPIDLTGISNENEFYTHHYLSAILENDLKDIFKEWRRREQEENTQPPYAQLKALARDYFAMRSRLERETSPEARPGIQREFLSPFLAALGYTFGPAIRELDDCIPIPVIGEVKRANGAPELWIIEAIDPSNEAADPLELSLLPCQYPQYPMDETTGAGAIGKKASSIKGSLALCEESIEEIVTRRIFGCSEPPRWVILMSDSQIVLLDRGKWNEKRLLRFDLKEILGRREPATLQSMAALLHRESVSPEDGMSLLDTLDENSHKHAFAVSEDLKYALRECIEVLGNEAVWYLREKIHEKVYGRELARQLTVECLRYMYRIIFLFYIEARPELGYAPMNADAYRTGYSVETLRDLEMVKLTTEEAKEGFFLNESIDLLFTMIYNGFPPAESIQFKQLAGFDKPGHHIFRIPPLKSHLFDPNKTPLLSRVRFRNSVLQRVIELMSLSRPKSGRERRGRISYAQLGINQLGAVYEALLSYQGFFAETDLYEVKKEGDAYNELETAYFVKAEDLEKYTEGEKVYNPDGSLKKYPKGAFIYRLAGRDREKSASYYTPEVLTQCLVKYALKELLKGKGADEILNLTICEPAMGSAAFLNEAVNQLAEAYLQHKQRETGEVIPHERYAQERQRVKMRIADHNVYGIDLNPVAVELAEVSLWLNTIHEGAYVSWFGMQLVTGNSLIGARRQIFPSRLLNRASRTAPLWLDEVPERVMPGSERDKKCVYHFLIPDKGMADYKDRVVRRMAEREIKAINEWRKGFTRPFLAEEIKRLERLSNSIDRLWAWHTNQRRIIRNRTMEHIGIFGQPGPQKKAQPTTTEWKDRVFGQEILSQNVTSSSPYRRLKLVMDYWCALWFWPIEKAHLLPTHEECMLEVSFILEGTILNTQRPKGEQIPLFSDTMPKQLALKLVNDFGFVDVDRLCSENERLGLVKKLSDKYRFLHWELEFADIFADRGGFDLVLGNPPWIKVEWNEGGVMGDAEPLFVLRNFSASQLSDLRARTLERFHLKDAYLTAFEEAGGTQNFLNGYQNYPLLKGIKANLYKCFLPQAWMIANSKGAQGFLHPEGIYDDPNGGIFREQAYSRLRGHFQFQNELSIFPIGHDRKFSINIYGNTKEQTSFFYIANLFFPKTVDSCFDHSGYGEVPGIKEGDEQNRWSWNIRGHKRRIIHVGEEELELFAQLYDSPDTPPMQAQLPVLHSEQLVSVLRKFVAQPRRLGGIRDEYYSTQHWNETNAQKDHTIRRETRFPENAGEWILSGPHFFVGNPFFQTPKRICGTNRSYDVLDLTQIPPYYLPRTNYLPNIDSGEYLQRTPKVPWENNEPVTNFYRLAYRAMICPHAEKTLIGAIIPKEVAHINGVQTTIFTSNELLLGAAFLGHSIVADFFIKTTGRSNLHYSFESLPFISSNSGMATVRTLMLNCVTVYYSELWLNSWNPQFTTDSWTKSDPRLSNTKFSDLTPQWQRDSALRTDYERRQALVEIDVLAALALGLTLDELKTIYRVQLYILRQYEGDTWYDQNGRIVFTVNKGLTGVGFPRPEWEEIKGMKIGTVERIIMDDTLPGGPIERTITYVAPFDRCDRERDYKTAWEEFNRRFDRKG